MPIQPNEKNGMMPKKGVNSMRECNFDLKFKADLSNIEIEGVTAIAVHFIASNNGELFCEFIDKDDFIYTSSSQYAMLSINDELILSVPSYFGNDIEKDELEVSHFAITVNNMLIMVCYDDDENYYYFEIEPSDFY